MASVEAEAFWDLIRSYPRLLSMPLAEARAAAELGEAMTSAPAGVVYADHGMTSGFSVTEDDTAPQAEVIYFFGSAYGMGGPACRRRTAGHLARASHARVSVPAYRLAPEHRFPAALDDALAAYRLRLDADPDLPIILAGDSAGGGLAVALALAVKAAGLPEPAGVLGFSPWVDLSCSGASMDATAGRDICCNRDELLAMAAAYLDGADPRDPRASPLFGDLAGFPPLYVVVGSEEVLLDDSIRLARAVGLAGGTARVDVIAGMQHVFPIWFGIFPEAARAMAGAGRWIAERCG